jgi:hypothetical protein
MTRGRSFSEQIDELKAKISKLPDTHSPEVIEATAKRLEGLNYAPSVITANADFLRMNRQGIIDEVDRILQMPEQEACALAPNDTKKCEDLRIQFINVIVYYYEKLLLLRNGDADEWDEVDELYVHD